MSSFRTKQGRSKTAFEIDNDFTFDDFLYESLFNLNKQPKCNKRTLNSDVCKKRAYSAPYKNLINGGFKVKTSCKKQVVILQFHRREERRFFASVFKGSKACPIL